MALDFMPTRYTSVKDVIAANREAGYFFFSPDTIKFFNARTGTKLFGGCYFVTSEQFIDSSGFTEPRMYTIRKALPNGDIETVGLFGWYASEEEAEQAIKQIMEES